jgi:Arc/MetJ-type ribon-helix-helix transcriptional regulator
MSNPTHINMPLPEHMAQGIKYLVEQGEFASQAEYIRYLIRTDLPRRVATLEQDKLILERLNQAKRGGPFIPHEEVKAYFAAKTRGEKPTVPNATIQK